MTLQVALETSTRQPSVAVVRGGEVHGERLDGERAHASDLLPALERCLARLGAGPAEIDAVFVGLGPGSYTGLRIGISTALGLTLATNAEVVGVPSGEVLAFGALQPGEEAVHLMDARQGELYYARFERTEDDAVALEAPCVLAPDDVRARLGDGVRVFADESSARILALDRDRVRAGVLPEARALLVLGRLRLARDGASERDGLDPLYLRPFRAKPRRR